MKRQTLRDRLRPGKTIVAPGVYDLISASMLNQHPVDAGYMTGFGVVASYLGLPDAGLATYTDMVDRAGRIAAALNMPLIADADTGYGGLLNVRHTVRGYEAAGVAAIQIEDQEFPKKCGHTPDRRVIPAKDMVRKIEVAVDSRSSGDMMIIARTDARTGLGLDEALRRGEAFAKAGADILFIEAPESVEELAQIGRSFDLPLVANMVEGGKTPVLPREELAELGFQIAIYPATGFLATAAALDGVYATLAKDGTTAGHDIELYNFKAFCDVVGFGDVHEFERRWAN
ncbi:MAG: isocitrate lyase/PEP mutase family protein [Hyphomicrobiales bacterium]|nr:isocitrate lyase/PEP mutase family protein [Hyphomicrobiales bacterium]